MVVGLGIPVGGILGWGKQGSMRPQRRWVLVLASDLLVLEKKHHKKQQSELIRFRNLECYSSILFPGAKGG
jgi:hypothetical protein